MNAQIEKIFACLGIFLFIFSVQGQNLNQREIRLNVSITDERGRFAGGLKAENFQVIVDKKPQEITGFTGQNEPATIVFLIDLSGSQKDIIAPVAKEIERFVKNADSKNEYIVLAFNTKIQLIADKTENFNIIEAALNKILATEPRGNTAFYDSLYAAIDKAESGKYKKKVLIVCGDGEDNVSVSYKFDDVTESLKRSDVLYYAVSYLKKDNGSFLKGMMGATILDEFSRLTGGKSFFPKTTVEISGVFDLIALELESQYRIAFRFANSTKPDKWREIKIKVAPVADPDKKVKVQARTRSGFYPASAQ